MNLWDRWSPARKNQTQILGRILWPDFKKFLISFFLFVCNSLLNSHLISSETNNPQTSRFWYHPQPPHLHPAPLLPPGTDLWLYKLQTARTHLVLHSVSSLPSLTLSLLSYCLNDFRLIYYIWILWLVMIMIFSSLFNVVI